MHLSANSIITNIIVTVLVVFFVVLLPYFDRKLCKKLGVNPTHKMSGWSREERLLRLRELIFYMIFIIYLGAYIYLVFFSRATSENYQVHVEPLKDLINSIYLDGGLSVIVQTIRSEGLFKGLSLIHIKKPEDIAQVYMNIMLFVPMGYLLPYVFNFIQRKVEFRPVLFCLLISILTENIQLIFKLGFYDMDDIISNTIGGLIGQILYISLAYMVERPDWKTEEQENSFWRRTARHTALFHMARGINNIRPTIYISDITEIKNFFIDKMGFMLIGQHPVDNGMAHLMKIGKNTFEIICYYNGERISIPQNITISVQNIVKARKQLIKKGFDVTELEIDQYTGFRKMSFVGSENIVFNFTESTNYN